MQFNVVNTDIEQKITRMEENKQNKHIKKYVRP